MPALEDIAKQTAAILVNTHNSLHGTRPKLPNIVHIGGIHINPKIEPLPSDIKKFLDDANEGVLFFSFGSMIKTSTLPKDKLKAIVKVISELPRKVLIKWEDDTFPDKPANLMIKKWIPQFDVLSEFSFYFYI